MEDVRKYWLDRMCELADPVLENLAAGNLHATLPNRFYGKSDRAPFGMLEAFGRTLCGVAPFLADFPRSCAEEEIAARYRSLVTAGLDNATNPDSPDFMNFEPEGNQPLVDAAFLCEGLLRSGSFAEGLSPALRAQIAAALVRTRLIVPHDNNWILFSAMVEAGLQLLTGSCDLWRVVSAFRRFSAWYVGDGVYGDGAEFHADYYNSYVIEPMLVDLARVFAPLSPEIDAARPLILKRAARGAAILERMINADGTYPLLGRSITYRYGCFHLLAQAMREGYCTLSPGAVRAGLTAVIRRITDSGIFDENGWLLHGVYGFQPSLAESYIGTGSLYLAATVFLPLGLPETAPFWSEPDGKWTSKRITDGEDTPADRHI